MVSGVTGRIPQGSDCVRPADAGNPTQLSCWTWQVEDHTGKMTEEKGLCADHRSYESQPWKEMNIHKQGCARLTLNSNEFQQK